MSKEWPSNIINIDTEQSSMQIICLLMLTQNTLLQEKQLHFQKAFNFQIKKEIVLFMLANIIFAYSTYTEHEDKKMPNI